MFLIFQFPKILSLGIVTKTNLNGKILVDLRLLLTIIYAFTSKVIVLRAITLLKDQNIPRGYPALIY